MAVSARASSGRSSHYTCDCAENAIMVMKRRKHLVGKAMMPRAQAARCRNQTLRSLSVAAQQRSSVSDSDCV